MNKYVKVKDHPSLVRDMNSYGVVNVDQAKYNAHLLQKQAVAQQRTKEQMHEEKINKLENDVSELKAGLNEILSILRTK
jgi:hypothetical protein